MLAADAAHSDNRAQRRQTIRTWSVLETIISVVGLLCVLLLNLVL